MTLGANFNNGGMVGYNEGGDVMGQMMAGAPPEAQQVLMALMNGQLDPESAIQALIQMGMSPPDAEQLIIGVMQGAQENPNSPIQGDPNDPLARNTGGPIESAADQLISELDSRSPAGLKLPTQTFNDGGKVNGVPMSAMAMSILGR